MSHIKLKKSSGFSLMEIMVVLVILSIVAGFAIPSYQNSVRKSHERDARIQLQTLHAANKIYRAQASAYWDPGGTGTTTDVTVINNNLSINIILNEKTINYTTTDNGVTYIAGITFDDFTVEVTNAELAGGGVNPRCKVGDPCPSL